MRERGSDGQRGRGAHKVVRHLVALEQLCLKQVCDHSHISPIPLSLKRGTDDRDRHRKPEHT